MQKRTAILFASLFLVMAVAIPSASMQNATAIQTQQVTDLFSLFNNPSDMTGALGTALAGAAGGGMFSDILSLMFNEILNFSQYQAAGLTNVFVFNASTNGSVTNLGSSDNTQQFETVAPFTDTTGNSYYVVVNRESDVNITAQQEAQIVLILWDHDGSLINALEKIINVVNEGITYEKTHQNETTATMESDPAFKQLVSDAASTISWVLIHINDIITGDEQFIFQPSYYWNYVLTGNYTETHTWYRMGGSSPVDPATINFNATAKAAPQMQYLLKPSISQTNKTVYDSGFLFHLFQLWIQKFHVSIDMNKVAALVNYAKTNNVSQDMLSNLLQGVDIQFTYMQSHLLGAGLFNDTTGAGVPAVNWTTTGQTYNNNGTVEKVVVPTTNELLYLLSIQNSGENWTVQQPTVSDGSVVWSVQFNDPTIDFVPVGMDSYQATLANASFSRTMTTMKFGFSFTPSFQNVGVPDANGNIVKTVNLGQGTIKLLQEFGNLTSPLPANLTKRDIGLAVLYTTEITNFDFSYSNVASANATDVNNYYSSASGTLDFLNASSQSYFGQVNIAGPDYTLSNGTSYPAKTEVIPFAFYNFTFTAQRDVVNDNFSISQGEPAFRQQSLYLNINSAMAFYCVAYPNWGMYASTESVVHDPTFTIFMQLQGTVPWGVILLVVAIGAIAAASIIAYFRRQNRL
jgi:Tfp pilus assembly protein FimT